MRKLYLAAALSVAFMTGFREPHTGAKNFLIQQLAPGVWAAIQNDKGGHVFYTGSTAVGKIIYKMAAEQLVPVTLELGGKSPCVVESDANIKVAARRIAIAKFSNAGQMCVAPDYVLVHSGIKEKFVDALKESVVNFFSKDPSTDYSYGKIINERQFKRLVSYLSSGTIVHAQRLD